LFVDDYSRCVTIKYLKTKNQATEKCKDYLTYIERQRGVLPKALHADNGREYVNNDLIVWCESKGIKFETTAPYSPEQNGVAEQMNCTLVELLHAMLIACNLPSFLWPEAVTYAAYVHNHSHTWALDNSTPIQMWSGQQPDVSHLQEFGSPVWVLLEGQNISKLEPKSKSYPFMGFEDGPKAIRYYDAHTQQIHVTRNYTFGHSLASSMSSEGVKQTQPQPEESSTAPSTSCTGQKRPYVEDSDENIPRRSTRPRVTHDYQSLHDPWAAAEETLREDTYLHTMTSAETIYTTFCETTVAPENPKA